MSRLCPWCLVLILGILSPSARGEDWLEFRGPGGQGHASAAGLPESWSETENLVWKQAIPGKGWSSPVVVGGQVYLTTAVPEGDEDPPAQSLRVVCLDEASGRLEWSQELFQQPAGQRVHPKNSHASATPISDGKRLYVHFGTWGTACLERDGTVVWKTTALKYQPVHGNGGSPVLFEDLLILNCDGADAQFVVALDRRDGTEKWRYNRSLEPVKGFAFCTPLLVEVEGQTQVISSGADAVVGLVPQTGEEIWRVRYKGGYSVVPRPVAGQGMVFVCTGYDSPTLLAIRLAGARGDVTDSHLAWKLTKRVPLNPSPLLINDLLYLVSDDGVMSCVEAGSGESVWQQRIGGAYSSSPTWADGRIYVQSEAGETLVIEPGREFREVARSQVGERTFASYAVAGGAIYLRTESNLLRLQRGGAK
ncbi:MAG: PQQ-binding-like beta-propeller repeat protein [Planctomycetaceae bacterium]